MASKFDKVKRKARDAAIRLGEFFTEPSVRKTSKFATGILEAMNYVDLKNPISLGTGALSLIDTALDSFEIPYPTKTEHFAKKRKLQVKSGGLTRILADAGIMDRFPTRVVFTDAGWTIKELWVDDDSQLYYAENADTSSYYEDPTAKLAPSFYHTPNFNFDKLFDAIWDRYKSGVFVSALNASKRQWEGISMRLHDLSTDDCIFVGEIDPAKFAEDLKQFRDENTSRSFMIVGAPGTGKTSFVIEVARNISNRIVRIDPTMAHLFNSGEFDFLIENLNPDIIVFDDFDRAAMSQDSQHLLFLLENIKYRFPKMIMFATVNYFEKLDRALVRPGRFDEIMWFDLPKAKIRAEIADKYLRINKIPVTPELLQNIVEKTEGLSPVYIKELCIRIRHKGSEALDEIISEFGRALAEIDGMYTPPQIENQEPHKDVLDEDFYIELQRKVDEVLFSDPIGGLNEN
jgi:hypothetical protein